MSYQGSSWANAAWAEASVGGVGVAGGAAFGVGVGVVGGVVFGVGVGVVGGVVFGVGVGGSVDEGLGAAVGIDAGVVGFDVEVIADVELGELVGVDGKSVQATSKTANVANAITFMRCTPHPAF